ncbi:MAG: DUF1987 domain-containing protein [Bacteroidales bacterium]|nr:DUF1987 domain-containing protein [Bacteroidales bacterium]
MEDMILQGSSSAPYVELKTNGVFLMRGRILTDNAVKTFEPLIAWIDKFKGQTVEFTIDLDYINTSASMQLFSVLRMLDTNPEITKIRVKWFYEHDDEDHLETGEFFEDKLSRSEFEYIVVKDKMVA